MRRSLTARGVPLAGARPDRRLPLRLTAGQARPQPGVDVCAWQPLSVSESSIAHLQDTRAMGVPPLGTTADDLRTRADRQPRDRCDAIGSTFSMLPSPRDIATKITPAAVAPGGSHPYTPCWDWDRQQGGLGLRVSLPGRARAGGRNVTSRSGVAFAAARIQVRGVFRRGAAGRREPRGRRRDRRHRIPPPPTRRRRIRHCRRPCRPRRCPRCRSTASSGTQVIVGNRVYATGQFIAARPAGAAAGIERDAALEHPGLRPHHGNADHVVGADAERARAGDSRRRRTVRRSTSAATSTR